MDVKNNPENSSTTKVSKHIPSIENKHDVYRGKDFMKKFYEFLRKYAMKIIS